MHFQWHQKDVNKQYDNVFHLTGKNHVLNTLSPDVQ